MIKFLPVLLAIGYGIAVYWFSAWRTRSILTQQSRPLTDDRLNALTQRLADALEVPAIKVHVFDVDQVNGLAAPDGRIFITRGFLTKYKHGFVTAEEMASVIAHELGHVALGHSKRRMIDVTGQNAVFVALSALLSRFLPFIGIWIAQMISTALAAGLSRKAEHEADAYASALLVKAGIGTASQKSLFRKLERLIGQEGAGPPDWLRSHPKTEDRIAQIEAREARWTVGPGNP
jgi:metalloprotease